MPPFAAADGLTVLAAFATYGNDSANAQGVFSALKLSGGGSDRADLRHLSNQSVVSSGGATQATPSIAGGNVAGEFVAALAVAADDVYLTDGTNSATDTSALFPVGIDTLQIGGIDGGTTNSLNGTIRSIRAIAKRLPNATITKELAKL